MEKLNVTLPETGNEMQTDIRPTATQSHEPAGSGARVDSDDPVLGELRPDGFSPGLDIDAVIQSFAPGQGQLPNPNTTYLPEGNSQFVSDGQPRQIGFGDQMVPKSGNAFFVPNHDHQQNSEGWYGQFMMPGPAFDDILFGFNGSMLDNMSAASWT
jgi:hypothetical protein